MISTKIKQLGLTGILLLSMVLIINSPVIGAQKVTTNEEGSSIVSEFKDVPSTDANAVFINYLSNRSILKGYPDGGFHPEDGLTRAQAAVVIVKAAGLSAGPITSTGFPDLAIEHWAAPSIAAAAKAGYLKGFPDGTFRPDDMLTRSQGISTLLRLSAQQERAALPVLKDIDVNHWAAADMATALTAGMIGLSADKTEIYPDAIMKRGSLARALGTLLTKDPGLYTVQLSGTIKDVKGDIKLTRQGTTTRLQNGAAVYAGDIIKSGSKASAAIYYPDGSSVLIQANSDLSIKESLGRAYIKTDGTAGIAVENVNIDMDQGTVFGALATKQASQEKPVARVGSPLLASLDSRQFIADQSQMPWFQAAETKKVRMTVDMPWGVAAVRCTFISVTIN
ncbi:MAG: S-layer homology domain-containing protein, partial [Syntrophomonas sp.]|nr:S-layer homology domain-containing protein [Syntrophomonas sp.]